LIAAMLPEGRLHVDVAVILRRQIVELAHTAIRRARVPLARPGVPLGIEPQYILQAVEHAVMHKCAARCDIAQRRRAECTTVLRDAGKVGAQRATEPKIVVAAIRVGRNRHVARHANAAVPEIGELRKCAAPQGAGVTAGAIALRRIVECG